MWLDTIVLSVPAVIIPSSSLKYLLFSYMQLIHPHLRVTFVYHSLHTATILFYCIILLMARLGLLSKAQSSPALPKILPVLPTSSPLDTLLIPQPLMTNCRNRKRPYLDGDAKEYSQTVVRNRSLGIKPRTEAECKERKAFYNCTLCHYPLPKKGKPYVLPGRHRRHKNDGDGRVFCKDCWIWIYDLSICWTCGEIVSREEERIGFGWCWWHWGCLGCLICKVRAGKTFLGLHVNLMHICFHDCAWLELLLAIR